jgi:hypothetical protein
VKFWRVEEPETNMLDIVVRPASVIWKRTVPPDRVDLLVAIVKDSLVELLLESMLIPIESTALMIPFLPGKPRARVSLIIAGPLTVRVEKSASVENRFVEEAVVEKRLVEVAFVVVDLRPVKF